MCIFTNSESNEHTSMQNMQNCSFAHSLTLSLDRIT